MCIWSGEHSRIFSRIHCFLPFIVLLFQFIVQFLGTLPLPHRSLVRQTVMVWSAHAGAHWDQFSQWNNLIPSAILSPTKETALTWFSLALNSQALFFYIFFSTFLIPNSWKEMISSLVLQRFLPYFKLAYIVTLFAFVILSCFLFDSSLMLSSVLCVTCFLLVLSTFSFFLLLCLLDEALKKTWEMLCSL